MQKDDALLHMNSSKEDSRKRERTESIDPLTGRKIHLAVQNGFSAFQDQLESNEKCFTTLQVKTFPSKPTTSTENEFEKDCVYKHQHDLAFKHGLKIKHGAATAIPVSFSSKSLARSSSETKSSYMQDFLKSWCNPVFGVAKDTALSAQINGGFPIKKRVASLLKSFPLSKDSLQGLEVIGQVDSKFMACKCTLSTDSSSNESSSFLLLIDQHAAHERIRLENLQEEFFSSSDKSGSARSIKSQNLYPPKQLSIILSSEKSLTSYKEEFEKIGVKFTIQSELKIQDKNYVTLFLKSLPSLFVTQKKDGDEIHPILEDARLKELFYEHLKSLERIPVTSSVIPYAINTVLSSYACHGAIKFGDSLSCRECAEIVRKLVKCNFPFQCAHGRPSIAPMVNLSTLRSKVVEEPKPRLWKLRNANKN